MLKLTRESKFQKDKSDNYDEHGHGMLQPGEKETRNYMLREKG